MNILILTESTLIFRLLRFRLLQEAFQKLLRDHSCIIIPTFLVIQVGVQVGLSQRLQEYLQNIAISLLVLGQLDVFWPTDCLKRGNEFYFNIQQMRCLNF